MSATVIVMGYGPIGRATVEALLARGDQVRLAQRSRPANLPAGVSFASCDVLDGAAVRTALQGVGQLVLAIGFPYDGRVWRTAWPTAMRNVLEAASATGTRVVFVDDLYMLGPQDAPLREDMPLTTQGAKPAVRAEVTRIWQAAAADGRVKSRHCAARTSTVPAPASRTSVRAASAGWRRASRPC